MQIQEDKVLKKIHHNDIGKYNIDLETYQLKKLQGLTPFLNNNNEVEWLNRDEYAILEIKKKKHYGRREKDKHKDIIDFAQKLVLTSIVLSILFVAYYILKIFRLF